MKTLINLVVVTITIGVLFILLSHVIKFHKVNQTKYHLEFVNLDSDGIELQEVWIMKGTKKVVLLDQIIMPHSFMKEVKIEFDQEEFKTLREASETYYDFIND